MAFLWLGPGSRCAELVLVELGYQLRASMFAVRELASSSAEGLASRMSVGVLLAAPVFVASTLVVRWSASVLVAWASEVWALVALVSVAGVLVALALVALGLGAWALGVLVSVAQVSVALVSVALVSVALVLAV